ncbi:MAG: YitT family protein, partial [Clostridia bacterium]|nr:YitT family protein [Clostridia bacterium]
LHKLVPHVSVASFILLIDLAVIAVSGIIFADYTLMFYSVIALFLASKVTDYILVLGNFAKCLFILSEKHSEISAYIMKDLGRGVTGISSNGLYTGKSSMMLMCIVTGKEVPKVVSAVKNIDRNAFTVISDVREVHGEGFIKSV